MGACGGEQSLKPAAPCGVTSNCPTRGLEDYNRAIELVPEAVKNST